MLPINNIHSYLILKEHTNNLNILIDKYIIKQILADANKFNRLINTIINNPWYFNDIVQTKEICNTLLNIQPNFIKYIKNQTPELCNKAVSNCGFTIKYVHNQTPELCEAAVRNNGYSLKYIKNKTHGLNIIAIAEDFRNIEYIKDPNLELCIMAININPYAIQYINEPIDYLCMMAINSNPDIVRYIGGKSEEFYINLLDHTGYALKHIKNQTADMCIKALGKTYNAEKYIKISSLKITLYKMYLNKGYIFTNYILRYSSLVYSPILFYYTGTGNLENGWILCMYLYSYISVMAIDPRGSAKFKIVLLFHYIMITMIKLFGKQDDPHYFYNVIFWSCIVGSLLLNTKFGSKLRRGMEFVETKITDPIINYITSSISYVCVSAFNGLCRAKNYITSWA